MSGTSLNAWALPQISRLLPLDEESLQQILDYTVTLSKDGAADHLKNLLGDSPQALEFVSSFNARRDAPVVTEEGISTTNAASEEVRHPSRPKKKKQPFNKLPPPRQPENYGNVEGAYMKRDVDNYVSGKSKANKPTPLASTLSLEREPGAKSDSRDASPNPPVAPRNGSPSRAALSSSDSPSRPSTPSKTKVNVAGGTSMRGQAAITNDLESAIRALEVQTNPNLVAQQNDPSRRCGCMAQRHELLAAAPNCTNCGKIICAKEGLGPCTFCGNALLSSSEIQAMIKVLRDERGKEKMEANNASQKRAEVSLTPRPFAASRSTPASSAPSSDSEAEKLVKAKQHRDRLLKFQADNTRRTQIHDEVADFQTPDAGQNIWASPSERALQLKRQQKVLREQEWNARPDYEKRRIVVSIDVVGGKAVKKMTKLEDPKDSKHHVSEEDTVADLPTSSRGENFSNNPLLGGLIRPVYANHDKGKDRETSKTSKWRRVQDDGDDNEHLSVFQSLTALLSES